MSGHEYVWPEKPQCHGKYSYYTQHEIAWTEENGVRRCSYCGSIHPQDLAEWLEHRGMKLEGADWKYGWPHKFYLAGNAPKYPIKFYNEHLLDLEGETFEYVAGLIETFGRIHFENHDGNLFYRAPHRGYQHWDPTDYKLPPLPNGPDNEGTY